MYTYSNLISAYKSGHFFNYFGIRPPEWLIDFLNQIKPQKNNRFIKSYYVKISNKIIHFAVDSKYEGWISEFIRIFPYCKENDKVYKTVLIGGEDTTYTKNCDIFFDLSDSTQLNKQIKMKKYIKRECNKQNFDSLGIIPLPYIFSNNYRKTKELNNKHIHKKTEQYFISFGGQIKSANNNRKQYITLLKKYYGKRFYLYGASFENHINILNNSKYAINLFGFGEYCTRFAEISNCTTLMLCQKYNIVIPNDFTDMENIVYFETFEELTKKIEILENNPDLYFKIYNGFKKHYQKYHTHEKYCNQLIEIINTP